MFCIEDHRIISSGILSEGHRVFGDVIASTSLVLSASSMVEETIQGTALFTATPVNAVNPGAVSIASQSIANALQMNVDGATVEAGSVPVNYNTNQSFTVVFQYTDDNGTYQFTKTITVTNLVITITTKGYLDGTKVIVGEIVSDAWVPGVYPDVAGNTVSETISFYVDNVLVADNYVMQTGEGILSAIVDLTAGSETAQYAPDEYVNITDFTFTVENLSWIVPSGSATVPDAFDDLDWTLADEGDGTGITISITALPADNGSAITDIQYRVEGGAAVSVGAATIGDYLIDITDLNAYVDNNIEIRAVNANGSGAWSSIKTAKPTDVPDAFVIGNWSIAATGTTGDATLTVSALPSSNGSAITDIVASVDGGAFASVGGATTGDYALNDLFTDGIESDVVIRAVNANGQSSDSDTKPVTTNAGGASPDISYIGEVTGKGNNAGTITLDFSGLSLQQDDFVVLYASVIENSSSALVGVGVNAASSGWTEETGQYANDNRNVSAVLAHKAMGATPDADVVVDSPVGSNYLGIVTARAYRNVDVSDPFDGSIVFNTNVNTGTPNISNYTPTDAGTVAVNFCVGSDTVPLDTATDVPSGSGYSNFKQDQISTGSYAGQICSSDYFGWAAGEIVGGNYVGAATGTTEGRCGATFGLRKAP